MRARLAIDSSQQICALREIVLRHKPNHLLKISPKGTVPVLWFPETGKIIDESLNIMHWALNQQDFENLLSYQESSTKFIQQNDHEFKDHLDRYKYPNRYKNIAPTEHRTACFQILQMLNQHLQGKKWLYGDHPHITDFAILPFIRQFRATDNDWFDKQTNIPFLQKWLHHFLTSERLRRIMCKYITWQEKDEIITFPRQ